MHRIRMSTLLLVFIILSFIIAGCIFFVQQKVHEVVNSIPLTTVSLSPAPEIPGKIILFNGESFHYSLRKISNNEQASLLPNFDTHLSSSDITASHSCTFLINGGFYTKEGVPIGLFITNGKILSKRTENITFNGFISQTGNTYTISDRQPEALDSWALQSGPLLVYSGLPRVLKLASDEPARRSVAALDSKNNLVFISVYGNNSLNDGPLLSHLPEIVEVSR